LERKREREKERSQGCCVSNYSTELSPHLIVPGASLVGEVLICILLVALKPSHDLLLALLCMKYPFKTQIS
jgi:hypothetical protein